MTGAIVDLGSNTFHVLIASWPPSKDGDLTVLHRSIYYTQLSKGGGNTIPEDIFNNALLTLHEISSILRTHKPDFVRVVGTAVMRTASNRLEFKAQAEMILQYPVEVLDGTSEANYVAKGSLLHPTLREGSNLIMDIGGGSTEFIYIVQGEIKIMYSTPLGVGVLKHHYFPHDVFLENNLDSAESHVKSNLAGLLEFLGDTPPDRLGGASGTFEAVEILVGEQSRYGADITPISGQKCLDLYKSLGNLTYQERLKFPNMPAKRADLIPVGLWLIQELMKLLPCDQLFVSHYAIKEGLLFETFRQSSA